VTTVTQEPTMSTNRLTCLDLADPFGLRRAAATAPPRRPPVHRSATDPSPDR
jgi:hypothetical protein